jgi:hypothetical protein
LAIHVLACARVRPWRCRYAARGSSLTGEAGRVMPPHRAAARDPQKPLQQERPRAADSAVPAHQRSPRLPLMCCRRAASDERSFSHARFVRSRAAHAPCSPLRDAQAARTVRRAAPVRCDSTAAPVTARSRGQLARSTAPETATTRRANRCCSLREREDRRARPRRTDRPAGADARVAARGRSCWRGSRGSQHGAAASPTQHDWPLQRETTRGRRTGTVGSAAERAALKARPTPPAARRRPRPPRARRPR